MVPMSARLAAMMVGGILVAGACIAAAPALGGASDVDETAPSEPEELESEAENTAPLTDTGVITFTDVDLVDGHTVSASLVSATDSINGAVAARGTLTPAVTNAATDGAGNTDILLTPSIETGNALFKMMVYFSGACAAGIVVGLKIPLVLTSRADPVAARLASIAFAATAATLSRS